MTDHRRDLLYRLYKENRAGGCEAVEAFDDARSVVEAILDLCDRPWRLSEVWADQSQHFDEDLSAFAEVVEHLTDGVPEFCERCSALDWRDEGYRDRDGDFLCESCYSASYFTCGRCERVTHDDDGDRISGETWCEGCRESHAYFCEDCDEWDTDSHDHEDPDCECEAPHRGFWFPANGDGSVREDERFTVTLPAGSIGQEGMLAIYNVVYNGLRHQPVYDLWDLVEGLEPVWQAKRGNFTRRLSAALYKRHQIKLPEHTISEVGNVARQHSSDLSGDLSGWTVEFTRDLNGSASAFYHEGSCWWGGYAYSRCSLKNWGGLAIRSYESDHDPRGCPTGRAWVQPLDDQLQPTHDTENAHAYVVYNGYGVLEGYTPARIVAHLTGRTYRKVTLGIDRQFVNNDMGYLVADAATCEATNGIGFGRDEHHQYDAYTINRKTEAA